MNKPVFFNTLGRKKEPFEPIDGKLARFYSCGPTVYNYAHIGNLRAYIFSDILKRSLIYNNIRVKHVMNITDVGHLTSDADEGEDKMEKGAQREGKTVWEIADHYTQSFKEDIAKLNILEPDIWCKATEHIEEQIAQVKKLEENGLTYKTSDGIYFDTSKLDDYRKLSGQNTEDLKAGARVEMGEKKNPTDFALWKFSPKDHKRAMEWDSPWGVGFPGWHLECSAMSIKYLGDQFDIHTGGIDHIQVHHSNEIAQAEGSTGKKPWVKFWMHGEFLVLDKGKMAKSGENFIILKTLEDKGFDPLVYRYMCLTAHYRQQLTFSWDALETAKNGFERIKTKILDLKQQKAPNADSPATMSKHEATFLAAINDDLNMPKALAALWDMLKDDSLSGEKRRMLAERFDEILGLSIKEIGTDSIPDEILTLADQRQIARENKDWATSDSIRDDIKSKGYIVDDIKDRYTLRKA
ncbi:cysteine--tRNA ligase [Candidatus Woesearchaeota archaeon]|nr:cysteine--tRNA ligase [Candidatus Woesearchaeota archaeon]